MTKIPNRDILIVKYCLFIGCCKSCIFLIKKDFFAMKTVVVVVKEDFIIHDDRLG